MREGQLRVVGRMKERMPVEMRTTAGAPYSAEAVTESTQTLPDGNRINRKVTTRVYRDSDGRTRRDQIAESGAVESTFIVDPQTGTNYVFEQNMRETMAGPETKIVSRHDGPPDVVEFRGQHRGIRRRRRHVRKASRAGRRRRRPKLTRGPTFMLQRTVSDGVTERTGRA